MKSTRTLFVALLATFFAFGSLIWAEGTETPALRLVEHRYVCMVNNQLFPNEQIPVQVEDKTYYGCCEMCKERLAKDQAARTAIDPVSGKSVDKANAVIGALPDGKVFYFESEQNLDTYRTQLSESKPNQG